MKLTRAGQEEVDQFRKKPLPFEITFRTPLKDLPRFVATILSTSRLEAARVTIDQVVFTPENLLALLKSHSILTGSCIDAVMDATGQDEIAALLEAALGDWVDFLFVSVPEQFAIYADHDEWTTFFTKSESELASLTSALNNAGFTMITDYQRF